jgi:hypothetical protein
MIIKMFGLLLALPLVMLFILINSIIPFPMTNFNFILAEVSCVASFVCGLYLLFK